MATSISFTQRREGKRKTQKDRRTLSLFVVARLTYSGLETKSVEDSMEKLPQTPRTTLKRLPQRGNYDRELINQILDEGFICHVGFALDGRPFVIPTGYARVGDSLIIHGSQASRMLRTLGQGIEVCVTVTLVDGLVLARSMFNHSMNYRSVVVFGRATVIDEPVEKLAALRALSEHMIPGRWEDAREPNERELQQTTVLSLPLTEASAKVRTGPPLDDEEDYELPFWAGVIPLSLVAHAAVGDARLPVNNEVPKYAVEYARPVIEP
jgi:nitroimidazol reductase NimA-like FMN-containing flavoprotein (pyridoxamine 5'-phosphate oxidase superfamily)